jgi:hypothetical protein
MLNATTYTVRELSLADMSRGFGLGTVHIFQSYYFLVPVFNPDLG